MRLIVQTDCFVRTKSKTLQFWIERNYVVTLPRTDFLDPEFLDSIVHRVACKVEKHRMNFHETLRSWYVLPDSEFILDAPQLANRRELN